MFVSGLRLRMLRTQIFFFSRAKDATLLLMTIKLLQWEFGLPGGSSAECREQKAQGRSPGLYSPVKSWCGKDDGENGKRLNHKGKRSARLKGGTWLLVLKAAGRLGKKGMGC